MKEKSEWKETKDEGAALERVVKKDLSEEMVFEQRTWSKKENELCDNCHGSSRCKGPGARMSIMCSGTVKSQCGEEGGVGGKAWKC